MKDKETPSIFGITATFVFLIFCITYTATTLAAQSNNIKIYPAPKGEVLSKAYKVTIAGKTIPVYTARIGEADNERRFKAVDDLLHSENYYNTAAFAYFDMQGSATVTVSIDKAVTSAKILPASAGIKIKRQTRSISFTVNKPQNLTIELNGEWVKSLHLFVNPPEINIPKATDPNVIYFGPGIHNVSGMVIGDNKTVYVAGGAIVRSIIGPNEKFGIELSGLKNYVPRFLLAGRNIKFRGRGIIDASLAPTHAGNFVYVTGSDITLEGIIVRNSCGWTIPVRQSERVTITNVKILGYRANSDGIDICNSRNITVDKCFVRTNDDLIVVKSWEGQGLTNHIVIKNCVLWNQLANSLSLGAELRENVSDVLFSNCDIIHDQGRAWTLHIFHSDASTISNIRFEDIRIEESHQFINLWIGKGIESYNNKSGSIRQVLFKNIQVKGAPLNIDLVGANTQSGISNITFQNVRINGRPLPRDHVKSNAFVSDITVLP
jgi:polygalacturonase